MDTLTHRRQFLISAVPKFISPNWKKHELPDGQILSYCPELEVLATEDRDGETWHIVGNAFQADAKLPTPPQQLATLESHQVPAATYTWAGRWALIGPEVILPDAAGLLGLFYFKPTPDSLMVSSSLAVLKQCTSGLELNHRKLGHYGLNWIPTPSTNLTNVMKLLPDQLLATDTGDVSYLKRTFPERVEHLSTHERSQLLFGYLTTIFRQLAAKNKAISIALTAGQDSRVSVAIALAAGT